METKGASRARPLVIRRCSTQELDVSREGVELSRPWGVEVRGSMLGIIVALSHLCAQGCSGAFMSPPVSHLSPLHCQGSQQLVPGPQCSAT